MLTTHITLKIGALLCAAGAILLHPHDAATWSASIAAVLAAFTGPTPANG